MNRINLSKCVALLALASATVLTGCKQEDLDKLIGKAKEEQTESGSNSSQPAPTPQPVGPMLSLADLKGKEYAMECIPSGSVEQDQSCQDMLVDRIDGRNTVYIRIMDAVKNGQASHGMGVWASKDAFQACGGIDLTDADKQQIETSDEPFIFNPGGVVTGSQFNLDPVMCPERDQISDMDYKRVRNYFTAGELYTELGGYRLETHDHWSNEGCEVEHVTNIYFTKSNTNEIFAFFSSAEVKFGNCADAPPSKTSAFLMRLLPVQ